MIESESEVVVSNRTADAPRGARIPNYEGALAYEAPFLLEKLLKDSIVDSEDEARSLFREVKRYFVLTSVHESRTFEMASLLVDEVWHQFVLFTSSYMAYCETFFGHYITHAPSNAPKAKEAPETPVATFDELAAAYEDLFDEPLPAVWRDATSVRTCRRVHVNARGALRVVEDGSGWVALADERGRALLDANDLTRDALVFIARTPSFYVRELPGALNDEEKVGLVSALVEANVLRLAS